MWAVQRNCASSMLWRSWNWRRRVLAMFILCDWPGGNWQMCFMSNGRRCIEEDHFRPICACYMRIICAADRNHWWWPDGTWTRPHRCPKNLIKYTVVIQKCFHSTQLKFKNKVLNIKTSSGMLTTLGQSVPISPFIVEAQSSCWRDQMVKPVLWTAQCTINTCQHSSLMASGES